MRIIYIILICSLTTLQAHSQEKSILVFDLVNGTVDSIPAIDFDTNITKDQTNHFVGHFDSNVETLEDAPPTENTYPNSQFTYKRQASLDLDLNNYPIRTSVKISYLENDTLKNICSGSFISRKHILTAAHSVSPIKSNTLSHDALKVFPIFDNGIQNSNFDASDVSKIYIFKDWSFSGEDFAVLELEEAIGEKTGWIGIGFDNDNVHLSDGLFYKFPYPSTPIPQIDPIDYNGDTLYYNYGKLDIFRDDYIGISGASGIPGESGSSITKIINNQKYITYGVLNYSGGFKSQQNQQLEILCAKKYYQ